MFHQGDLRAVFESHRILQSKGGFASEVAAEMDASKHQCEENIYALVIAFSAPKVTKKGHWMQQVTLVDESISPEDHDEDVDVSDVWSSTQLLIFAKARNSLPRLRSAGDVLRLHRVGVQVGQRKMFSIFGFTFLIF